MYTEQPQTLESREPAAAVAVVLDAWGRGRGGPRPLVLIEYSSDR